EDRRAGRGGVQKARGARPAPAATPSSNGSQEAITSAGALAIVADSPVQAVARTRRVTGKRVLISLGVVALLLIAGGGAYAYWVVQRAMPTINGSASLPGLSSPVTVTRDVYGVPHILASNVQDVYAAQGYVHAQDRLFQMFYYRQLGAGKLAEAF